MPSAFCWPVLVPCALRAPAPVNRGVRPQNRFSVSLPSKHNSNYRRDNTKIPSSDQAASLDSTPESLGLRIAAALIAIPVFELSLYFGLQLFGSGRRSGYLFILLPMPIHLVYIGAAVVVGLTFGFGGITWLLGHLFFTHFRRERNIVTTVGLWAAILGCAFIASRFVK